MCDEGFSSVSVEVPDEIKISKRGETFKIKTNNQCGFFKIRVTKTVSEVIELTPSAGFVDKQSDVEIKIECNDNLKKDVKIQINFYPCVAFTSLSELFNDPSEQENVLVQTRTVLFEEYRESTQLVEDNYEESLMNKKLTTILTDFNTYVLHKTGEMSDRNQSLLSKIAGQLGVSQATLFRKESKSVESSIEKTETTEKNSVVTTFLNKLCNFPNRELSEGRAVRLDASYVLLQQTTQFRSIPRLAAQHNLQLLALSGSKKLVELVQRKFGGGSYWYLKDHFGAKSAISKSQILARPENGNGVIIAIGDNIQPKVTASSAYVVNQKVTRSSLGRDEVSFTL